MQNAKFSSVHSLLKWRILARYLKCAAKYLKAISSRSLIFIIFFFNFLQHQRLKSFFYFLLTISLYFIIDTSVLLQSFFFSSRVVSKCKAIFKFFSCQGYENEKDLPHFQLKIISRVTLSEKSSSAYIKTIPLDNIWLRWQLIHLNVFCKVFQRFVKWAATTLWIRKVALNVIYISFAGTISLSRKGYFFFFHKKSIKLHSRKF